MICDAKTLNRGNCPASSFGCVRSFVVSLRHARLLRRRFAACDVSYMTLPPTACGRSLCLRMISVSNRRYVLVVGRAFDMFPWPMGPVASLSPL